MDIDQLFSVAGRSALVTGGSRGIGRMMAEGLVRAGARVYICARKADECQAAASELAAWGQCTALEADLSTLAGIAALVAAYRAHEPSLDILINNAGAAWGAPYDEFPESGWDKVVDLNLKAPFFLTQALTPLLRKAAADHDRVAKVINVASIDGITVPDRETYSYVASKAGLIHMTRLMAVRLAPEGIAVSAIAPGAFASRLNQRARDHGDETARRVPLRRIGTPEDMAGAAIYLASRAGDYVVGSPVVVDGGRAWVR